MISIDESLVKKRLTIVFIVVVIFAFLASLTVYRYQVTCKSLNNLDLQFEKVLTTAHLQQNLITQSFYIKGYMLYGEPEYLKKFLDYDQLNQEEIKNLIKVLRPARKPIAEDLLKLDIEYNQICKEEIIPLVQKRNFMEASLLAEDLGAQRLIERCINYAKELELVRSNDIKVLFSAALGETKTNIIGCFGLLLTAIAVLMTIVFPITRKVTMENKIFRLILATTKNAVIIIRRDGSIRLINRVCEDLFEIKRKEVLKKQYSLIFTGRHQPGEVAFSFPIENVIQSGQGMCNIEMDYLDNEQWQYNLLVDCLPIKENRYVSAVALFLRDKTERKVIEDKLKGMAVRDAMTLLYNHSYLKQTLEMEIQRASTRGTLVSFIIADIDNFKFYNDNFGHPAGDELLKKLSYKLTKNINPNYTVGRYGSDEFAVILPGTDQKAAESIAERLRLIIEECNFSYKELMPGKKVTISIGIACYPQHAKSPTDIIKLADEAMYRAKRSTKNKVEVYRSVLKELLLDENSDYTMGHNLKVLLTAIKIKDPYTYSHSEKVALLSDKLAKAAGLSHYEINQLRMAALLHDLGKLEIPLDILTKPEVLNNKEWEVIQLHPISGAEVVKQIKPIEQLAPIILHHHERYDGRGYPDGLSGNEIPLESRIIAIADSFDAMTTMRPYRSSRTKFEALKEIEKGIGTQFDPSLANIFISLVKSENKHLVALK